jgi:hypothetical protein
MRKVKLELDALAVESFETAAGAPERGTVHAHGRSNEPCNSAWSCHDTCYFISCYESDCGYCLDTYNESCDISCYDACATRASCLGMDTCIGTGDQTSQC